MSHSYASPRILISSRICSKEPMALAISLRKAVVAPKQHGTRCRSANLRRVVQEAEDPAGIQEPHQNVERFGSCEARSLQGKPSNVVRPISVSYRISPRR